MKEKLILLLRTLEASIPPPHACHHAIVFCRYGNEQEGWKEKLALQINKDGTFHTFFLDDEDFEKEPETVAAEMTKQIKDGPDGQLAVGIGQFK